MALEIERKFLVEGSWPAPITPGLAILQAYLPQPADEPGETRVRLARHPDGSEQAWLTKKSDGGLVRTETEVDLPVDEARALMSQAVGNVLEKVRHALPLNDGLVLEVDVYAGALAGLVVAEVELPSVDTIAVLPEWLGTEVTEDKRYKNKSLAQKGLPESQASAPPTLRRPGPGR